MVGIIFLDSIVKDEVDDKGQFLVALLPVLEEKAYIVLQVPLEYGVIYTPLMLYM